MRGSSLQTAARRRGDLTLIGDVETSVLDVRSLPIAALLADDGGGVIEANGAWHELFGLSSHASRGDGWMRCFGPSDRDTFLEDLRAVIDGGGPRTFDRRITTNGGRCRWTRWWLSADGRGGEARAIVTVADVDEDRTIRAELHHQATHDPLTGLVNRAHFFELVERAMWRRQRHPHELAVLFVDLDRFKDVNDALGHLAGDLALVAVGSALQHVTRPEDVLARVGGDEFAVLCDDLDDRSQATTIIDRIRSALAAPIPVGATSVRVGVSIGVAFLEPGDRDAETLVDRADRAMYDDKRASTGATVDGVPLLRARARGLRPIGEVDGDANDPAHHVVRALLDLGCTIAVSARNPDEPITEGVARALAGIDEVIRGLRMTALDGVTCGSDAPMGEVGDEGST